MNNYSDESPNYADYELVNDKGQDISFHGLLIGHVTTEPQKNTRNGRWVELACYKTKSNKVILHKLGCSDVAGESNRSTVIVEDSPVALMDQYGYDTLAKSLYEQCGFKHSKQID